MSDKKEEKRGEINGMSFGKIMTSMLIPKDSRTSPKRILSGIAFLAFICFFLFAAMGKGCQRDAMEKQQEEHLSHHYTVPDTRQV